MAEGDISETCFIARAPVKKVILEEPTILKLEAHTMLNILAKTISEVADAMESREAWG